MHGRTQTIFSILLLASYLVLVSSAAAANADETTIFTIDTYGLAKVSREAVLAAAGIHVGDPVPDADELRRIERKLKAIPGIEDADISVIRNGRSVSTGPAIQPTVYIGVRESGRPVVTFRDAPTADVTLPEEIVALHQEFERSFRESIRSGNFSEDDSHGYALLGTEATRAIQKRFMPLAEQHFDRIVEVLRTAKSDPQRAIAATVVAFGTDKTKIAAELTAASRDSNDHVRNNAIRALGVILSYAQEHRELAIEVSPDVYLELIESLEWTDRNKAMFVLLEFTKDNDPALLARLTERSLPALVEMARWNTEGHAIMALLLVGRIAQMSEREVSEAWQAEKRETVIARAMEVGKAK